MSWESLNRRIPGPNGSNINKITRADDTAWLKPRDRTITIDDEADRLINEWHKKHLKKCKGASEIANSSVGGSLAYIITPTGIGECVSAKCNACQKEFKLPKSYYKNINY